ncbi:hypothetical protein JHD47_06630 [Sulfurimonas sp. SAG-AH-194-L11]|nr:hypothetical protein [Sulfurimonas sp. SAG-AH-194-L11]MDF1877489.1 hypothetical protein [Sulfurimonas sp. SAG-AH-194-L11]
MKKTLLLTVLTATLLSANTYQSIATATADSKKTACEKALAEAKVDAMEQAGTMVYSNMASIVSDSNGKIQKLNESQVMTAALGVAKLKSKKEAVTVSDNYQFTCKVATSFEIDPQEMKESLQDMLAKKKEQKALEGYFTADAYSEEGQSRYKANTAATMLAQRNLLELIKGTEITSLTKVENGMVDADKVAKIIGGKIKGAEIVKKEYDATNRSSHVVIRIKKATIADALDSSL